MKKQNLKRICTTFNNTFVLEQLLQEFSVNVIERVDTILGITVTIEVTGKLMKDLKYEFQNECNHPLIILE